MDVNQIVGLFGRRPHTMSTDLTAFLVGSEANIWDAGSRIEDDEDLHDIKRLTATFVPPSLREFVYNIWSTLPHSEEYR